MAPSDKGTLCSLRIFMCAAGRVHVCEDWSISSHVACRTSPARAAVKIKNSNPSFVEGLAREFLSPSARRGLRRMGGPDGDGVHADGAGVRP